jgi:Phosphoesterase family
MAMAKGRRRLLAAAVFLLVLAAYTSTAGRPSPGTGTAGTPAGSGPAASGGLRAVRHVWIIELENQGYTQSFGTPSADPYLAQTLPRMGALLENYCAIGHSSAANYVAQVSGQAPNIATQSDCPLWMPFPGQVIAGPYHQVIGEGCVYPAAVQTLSNQLSAARRSWAAYLQDIGNDPARDDTAGTARGPACGHPATWAIDHTQKAAKGDQYADRHDGFAFFRSVTGSQAYCDAHILSFRPLPGDLTRVGTTPAFSWISPNLCNDGHDAPGTISTVDYNHYSLLRTVEDIFGLPHLGDAAMPQVRSYGPYPASNTRSTISGSTRRSASPTRTPPSRTWISFGGCRAAASHTVTAPAGLVHRGCGEQGQMTTPTSGPR